MAFSEAQYLIIIDPDYLDDTTRKDRLMTPDLYIAGVRNCLRNLSQTQVGDVLLRSIRWHGHHVRIHPQQIWDTTQCPGAEAAPGKDKDLVYNRWIRPRLNLRAIRATVGFIPSVYAPGGTCHTHHRVFSDYTPTPEHVLLHELVHAFRHVSGKFNPVPATHGGLSLYDAPEEFYAILVESLYQSEVGGTIRGSHHGFKKLAPELEGSLTFFKVSQKAFAEVDTFCRDNPGLTRALAKVHVPFNPIAAYYHHPRQAQANSRSPFAAARDAGPFGIPGMSWEVWRKVL